MFPCASGALHKWYFHCLKLCNTLNSDNQPNSVNTERELSLLLTFAAGTVVGVVLQAVAFGLHPTRWIKHTSLRAHPWAPLSYSASRKWLNGYG